MRRVGGEGGYLRGGCGRVMTHPVVRLAWREEGVGGERGEGVRGGV